MRRSAFLLVAFSLLLAGCAGGNGGTSSKGVKKFDSTVGVDDASKGKILGVVSNEEELPLEGAAVGILDMSGKVALAAVTDAAGNFAFLGVEPGSYALAVTKAGFADQQKNLAVEAGGVVELAIVLTSLASIEPYYKVRHFDGMTTGYGYKLPVLGEEQKPVALSDVNKNSDSWKTTPEPPSALQNMVGELQWTNTQVLGGNLRLAVVIAGQYVDDSKHFIDKEGQSPVTQLATQATIQGIVNKNDPECKADGKACFLAVYVYPGVGNTNLDVDFALALTQRFNAKITTFFRMDAPKDYSAFR